MDQVLLEIILNATMREPAAAGANEDGAESNAGSVPAGDAHIAALLRTMPGAVLVTGDRRLAEAVRPWCEVLTLADFVATLAG